MYTTNGKNQALDATDITHIAAHTAWPADTFANETSGGSPAYARKTISFSAASGGTKVQSGTSTFDIASGQEIRFITGATAISAGNQRVTWVLGGSPVEYTVDPSTDVFTKISHGFSDTQKVVFIGGSVPTGLTIGTIYFVRDATTDTFKVAATSGGSAIDITARPTTADAWVSPISPDTGGQRTLALTNLTLNLNQ